MKLECGKVYRTNNNAKVYLLEKHGDIFFAALTATDDGGGVFAAKYTEDGDNVSGNPQVRLFSEWEPSHAEFEAGEPAEFSDDNTVWVSGLYMPKSKLHPHGRYTVNNQFSFWKYCRKLKPEKKWRVPTDEDAIKRPPCRAKDNPGDDWEDQVLVAVNNRSMPFITRDGCSWTFCEIEDIP